MLCSISRELPRHRGELEGQVRDPMIHGKVQVTGVIEVRVDMKGGRLHVALVAIGHGVGAERGDIQFMIEGDLPVMIESHLVVTGGHEVEIDLIVETGMVEIGGDRGVGTDTGHAVVTGTEGHVLEVTTETGAGGHGVGTDVDITDHGPAVKKEMPITEGETITTENMIDMIGETGILIGETGIPIVAGPGHLEMITAIHGKIRTMGKGGITDHAQGQVHPGKGQGHHREEGHVTDPLIGSGEIDRHRHLSQGL